MCWHEMCPDRIWGAEVAMWRSDGASSRRQRLEEGHTQRRPCGAGHKRPGCGGGGGLIAVAWGGVLGRSWAAAVSDDHARQ